MKSTILILVVVATLSVLAILAWNMRPEQRALPGTIPLPAPVAVTSFETCAAAGNPVMESHPRRCATADGRTFTEVIETEGNETPSERADIHVSVPQPNAVVTSSLVVSGEARGSWFFEASFPVRLVDANGKELAVKPAEAKGEWMTSEFVPFETVLEFVPTTKTGTIILMKDNPSGRPELDARIEIPVRFE